MTALSNLKKQLAASVAEGRDSYGVGETGSGSGAAGADAVTVADS
jgi:hypothetical protein